MFDVRYHALSLAAIFIALVVGLLLGVAIGDKELVSSARNDVRNMRRICSSSSTTRTTGFGVAMFSVSPPLVRRSAPAVVRPPRAV